jgi:hypothetical protein
MRRWPPSPRSASARCGPDRVGRLDQRCTSGRRVVACVNVSAATSERRKPQPRRTARMARSRSPRSVEISGALSNACACFCDSQLPVRLPCVFALFTREMPAASSGASRALSAASAASLRIADIRMMIDDEPTPRSASEALHALTVALVKPGRGAAETRPRVRSAPYCTHVL